MLKVWFWDWNSNRLGARKSTLAHFKQRECSVVEITHVNKSCMTGNNMHWLKVLGMNSWAVESEELLSAEDLNERA